MDVLTPEQRRRCMKSIKARDTAPEVLLRKSLFARGLRYRIHAANLPGTPDIVFPKYRTAVFVHGCFWHSHGCHLFVMPVTNTEFWRKKIHLNRERDKRVLAALRANRWRALTIWECAIRGRERMPIDSLACRVEKWLLGRCASGEIQG